MLTGDDSYTFHSWDDSEWSNHPYFASSGIAVKRTWQDANGDWQPSTIGEEIFENAYAIDLRTGLTLQLATTAVKTQSGSTHLKWPMLWIEKAADFSEDAGWL